MKSLAIGIVVGVVWIGVMYYVCSLPI